MAYASLLSLAQTIEKLLQDHDQYPISRRERKQITSIHTCTIFLLDFFEEFPEKTSSLERRIRDVANKAEDIIEDLMSEQIRRYISSEHQSRKFSWLERMKSVIVYMKLKKVSMGIGSIKKDIMEVKNRTGSTEGVQRSTATPSQRQLALIRKESMVGFNDDLMAVMARLCGESSELQIIPILGMGGIGKTTLARNAYDDPLSVEHFDIRAWVTISQDYSAQEILSRLLISMQAERSGQSDESQMAEIVYKSLKGRRYLIVMDDMWSTKAWDDVRRIFPNDHNGSRVVLTTRLSDVATYPDSSSPVHEMSFMDADRSWDLLKHKVFPLGSCPPELETIGKEIAISCRGLPLAIVLIAGLLTTVNKTQASWDNIERNVNLVVHSTNGEQFGKRVLSLSYNHLSHHLRPCFLYMGAFPEDYEIHASKLIKLWVADGFLKPSASKTLEEVAEEYLEELAKRSLVMVVNRKANGKIRSCFIHDLLRDLCIRKAQEEKFHLNVMHRYVPREVMRSIKGQRRIIIVHSDLNFLENIHGSTIHTIMSFETDESSLRPLGNFRLLRVLDLMRAVNSYYLPDEVFELFQLRYLAYNHPIGIPDTISNLKNLQTLIIHYRGKGWKNIAFVIHLPSEIWRMPQLRHLVSKFSTLPIPEGATFALKNLQTISGLRDFICSEGILKMIPNIKKLGIFYYGDEYVQDYHLDNLVYLHQLENLSLTIHDGFQRKLNPVFPQTLKKLNLHGWRLPWKDMSIVGSLPALEVLKLHHDACVGDKWETTEGEFQCLKFLLI